MYFAASKPTPVFAPVMMIVLPAKSPSGRLGRPKTWRLIIFPTSFRAGIVLEFEKRDSFEQVGCSFCDQRVQQPGESLYQLDYAHSCLVEL